MNISNNNYNNGNCISNTIYFLKLNAKENKENKNNIFTNNNIPFKRINTVSNDEKIKKNVIKIMKYNDEELNGLEYNLALKLDKRNYCQYYLSLLKTNHDIISTFCNNNDYNSKIIKIDWLIFNFGLEFAVNALFFNDDTMHKIYEDNGDFNLLYQLPQILYSSIISDVFNYILRMLALSQDNILDFKGQKGNIHLDKSKSCLNFKIKIKLR